MAKRKTASEWAQIVTDCKSSGLTVKKWCETNQVKLSSYKYWFARLNKQDKPEPDNNWAEVKMPAEETSMNAETSPITIRYGGFSIDISSTVETQLLVDVLKALRCIC